VGDFSLERGKKKKGEGRGKKTLAARGKKTPPYLPEGARLEKKKKGSKRQSFELPGRKGKS